MTVSGKSVKPAIIAISSHVARGSVGNRAMVFALETLGFPVWSVPTVTLPWHPGHGPSTKIIPDEKAFSRFIADLAEAPWTGEVGAIVTGYFGDATQVLPVAALVTAVKRRNPDAVYLCDPVIGDDGGLYVAEQTATAIRDRLLPIADITTPNRFELQWLTGMDGRESLTGLAQAARHLGPPTALVTSAGSDSALGNLLVSTGGDFFAAHQPVTQPPNGLGDLTAALFLAHRMDGRHDIDNLLRTTSSVYAICQKSVERGADELMLESDSGVLDAIDAGINIRPLGDR